MSATDINVLRTWPVPETLSVGCTECGQNAVEVLVAVSNHEVEVIEAHCREHREAK